MVLLLGGLTVFGCVRRTVTVNTQPQGAEVVLNDVQVGTSPVDVDFTWYGDYSVIIRKEGYETLKTHERLKQPWYQYPPMDFVAEVLLPFEFHDQQKMSFTLEPAEKTEREELVEQAGEFRERTLFGED
jgi:hypothetical protein